MDGNWIKKDHCLCTPVYIFPKGEAVTVTVCKTEHMCYILLFDFTWHWVKHTHTLHEYTRFPQGLIPLSWTVVHMNISRLKDLNKKDALLANNSFFLWQGEFRAQNKTPSWKHVQQAVKQRESPAVTVIHFVLNRALTANFVSIKTQTKHAWIAFLLAMQCPLPLIAYM